MFVHVPEHPNAYDNGCVYEHRVAMENHLGRLLHPNEHVHHIDHDGFNNDLANLSLMTKEAHLAHHGEIRQLTDIFCLVCHHIFSPSSYRNKYCSVACANLAHRKVFRPDAAELRYMIRKYPFTTLGQLYGVSDNAVRKWAKRYGIM